MEKVSVIIPTYNRGDKILKSINSVLNQTYSDLELLVVDDGSVDETEAVMQTITDDRVRYIKLQKNSGASNARNVGVEYATGEWIAFEDSDDLWKEDKLEKQMDYGRMHPECAMIYCQYKMHIEGKIALVPNRHWAGELEGDIFPWLLVRNTIGTPTMLMKKTCFQEVGGFDTTLRSLEDWEFAIRFAEKYLIGFVEEPLVDAYHSAGGVSSGTAAYYESRCKMVATYKEQMIQYNIFDTVVGELFTRAGERGLLEPVKQMLMNYLKVFQ